MFVNREDGARKLAHELKLKCEKLCNPIVLAIPRGGVVTGAVLAQELDADLDIVLSRKLRAPTQPELAIGAVGEDGEIYIDDRSAACAGADDDYIERERRLQMEEIARRNKRLRTVRPHAGLAGRSVILTDDGIATGATMIAAIRVIRAKRPHELIVAVPVASPERIRTIADLCDQVVCLSAPEYFEAVGQFYDDFEPVQDEEVVQILTDFAPHLTVESNAARKVHQSAMQDF
jgi:putative phosphoribosyl transferase